MKEKILSAVDAELLRNGGKLHVGDRVGVIALTAAIIAAAGLELPEGLTPEPEEVPTNDGRGSAVSAEAAAAAKQAREDRAAAEAGLSEVRKEAEADKQELQEQIAALREQVGELVGELKNAPSGRADLVFASDEAGLAFAASDLTEDELAATEPSSTKGYTKGDVGNLINAKAGA